MKLETFIFSVNEDGIAHAKFDVPGRSMNTLTRQAITDIAAITKEVSENDRIKGLIISSGKTSGFCAGADLGEMEQLDTGGKTGSGLTVDEIKAARFERGFALNKTLRDLETCGKPVAVAINGLALGGGLEVALAGHYRVAANDNPKLQLGLPEAKVGLLPGAGGTQRLPRLIGLQAALPLILEGRSFDAQKALSMGVVHALATSDELVDHCKAWIGDNPNAKAPWDEADFKFPGGTPYHDKNTGQVATMANAMVIAKTHGNYPAQKNILSCLYEGSLVPIDAALRIETRYFLNTQQTPQAQAMIRSLFLSTKALSKGGNRPAGIKKYTPKKVAIIGAGLMGAGIAYEQARAGIETVLIDTSLDKAKKGKAYSRKLTEKLISRGKMTEEQATTLLSRIQPETDYTALAGVDLVIEAVFENVELKHDIIKMAEAHVSTDAIMGSNTSTLPITDLADASIRPENFIGIHFFSPVERMGLVEIIMGKKTSQEALARSVDYALKIGKTPIIVNDSRGFYTSRCFTTYTREGMEMLFEGIKPAIIENVGRQSGMPMGPLEVSDSVGLDTALKITRQTAQAMGVNVHDDPRADLFAWIVEDQNRTGRKSGKGFYDYNDKGKPDRLWTGLEKRVEVKTTQCPPDMKKELIHRFLVRQAIEVALCFEEGVITDARDADIGSILAWGFPPYTGGCVSYIDLFWGVGAFVAEADRLADLYGERFRPCALLRDMATRGESFYRRFPPAGKSVPAAA